MKCTVIIFLCLLQTGLFAQKNAQARIDSLLHELPALKEDTLLVKTLLQIAQTYLQVDPRKGIAYAERGLAMAEKMKWKRGIANLQNALGLIIGDTGNDEAARAHFEQSLALNKEMGASFNMISNLNNIGRSYQRESDFSRALDYYFRALAIAEEIKSDEQISLVGTNLAASYITQRNFVKGLEYAQMTLQHAELAHASGNMGKALLDLGVIKEQTGDTASAKAYLNRALKVYEDAGN